MIEKIKANTLIMTGEYDVGSTVEMSKELNKIIKNSEVIRQSCGQLAVL